MKPFICFLFVFFTVIAAAADPFTASPELALPQASSIEDLEHSAGMTGFHFGGGKLFPAEAKYYIGTNGTDLFLTCRASVSPAGLKEKGSNSGEVLNDDTLEFVLVPNPKATVPDIYHIIVNNQGKYYSVAQKNGVPAPWKPKFRFKGNVEDGFWTFRMILPLKEIGVERLTPGQTIGFRFGKNWRNLSTSYGRSAQTSWNRNRPPYFGTISLPLVTFEPGAPAVRMISLMGKDAPLVKLEVTNPNSRKETYLIRWLFQPTSSQKVDTEYTVEVNAGETKNFTLPTPQLTSTEKANLYLAVSSPDKTHRYYTHSMLLDRTLPADIFEGNDGTKREPLNVQYAVYPYFNQLFVRLDPHSAKAGTDFGTVTAEVCSASGEKLAAASLTLCKNGFYEKLMELPDLAAFTKKSGSPDYVLTVRASGIKNGVVSKNFKRQVFEWEHNSYGKSDVIVPPFTPIVVKGNTVSTILRQHTVDGTGLWKQVAASGKPVFKEGGIRLEVTDDTGTHKAEGRSKFTETKPTRVKSESVWSAGKFSGSAKSEWDYDGMMKMYLTLNPGKAKSVKIVIPFEANQAKLFHACTDGLRFNYSGAVPAGTGCVWKSSDAPRNELVTSYVPYIFIGTAERGFCVFGENDKGWIVSSKVPAQEVYRHNDGSVDLILNLVPEETEWKEPRTILIGFMASPVKPRPENWRRCWPGWPVYGFPAEQRREFYSYLDNYMTWYGCCWYWGGDTDSGQIYPRDMDVSIWKMLKKLRDAKTMLPEAEEFLKQWMKKYEKYSASFQKTIHDHVHHGMTQAAGVREKNPVTFYTNAKGERLDTPEGITFQDEWMREAFQGTRDHTPVDRENKYYSADNGDSFRDFAAWWHHKIFEIGVSDHIMWDDVFLAANHNRGKVNPESYYLPDGTFQPSCGLFHLRELIRRTAILQYEMGRPSHNAVHITNTALIPVISFAWSTFDWENVSHQPFQAQYSREAVQVEAMGIHTGCVASIQGIPGGRDADQKDWLKRTGSGLTLTHELTRTAPECVGQEYWDAQIHMRRFGYGTPAVQVFNYWSEDYPVEITGGETSSLYLKKGNEAIVIICDYKDGGKYKVSFKDGFVPESALNLETEMPVKVKNGVISFSLKQYDFIIFSVRGMNSKKP